MGIGETISCDRSSMKRSFIWSLRFLETLAGYHPEQEPMVKNKPKDKRHHNHMAQSQPATATGQESDGGGSEEG